MADNGHGAGHLLTERHADTSKYRRRNTSPWSDSSPAAHDGRPKVVFTFTISDGKITGIAMDADPGRLRDLDIVFLNASDKER